MSKLITPGALQSYNLAQLQALYREVQSDLHSAPKGSCAFKIALANLEVINRAIAMRRTFSGPRF